MSAPSTKLYRVTFLESNTYAARVQATSKAAAESKVRRLWDRGETDDFTAKQVSLEYVDAELF